MLVVAGGVVAEGVSRVVAEVAGSRKLVDLDRWVVDPSHSSSLGAFAPP